MVNIAVITYPILLLELNFISSSRLILKITKSRVTLLLKTIKILYATFNDFTIFKNVWHKNKRQILRSVAVTAK